jgi:tetratricopeptide (TPR) repeat protein
MKIKIAIPFILLLAGQIGLAQAPADLQAALEKHRAKDDLSGWIYDQLQWVARAPAVRSGQLVQAVRAAWRRPHTDEEAQAWLDLLTNEGYALLLNGAIVPSTDAYVAAYDWVRQHREIADESMVLETILKPLGNNYTRLGDYEQALFIHRKALALAMAGTDKQTLAGVYSNLANTSSNMGRPEQSLDYCRQGLDVVNPSSALCGLLLSEQADAAMQVQKTALAQVSIGRSISLLEKALAKKEHPAAAYWLFMAYQQAGDIYATQADAALRYYKKALVLEHTLQQEQGGIRQRERAKLFLRLGSLFARTGQQTQAISSLDECLGILVPGKTMASMRESDLFAENTLVDVLYIRAGVFKQQKDTDDALRLYALSFIAENILRHELISGSSRERAVADTRYRYEEAIGFAWESWASNHEKKYLSGLLRYMENSKSQLLLEEVQQQQLYRINRQGDSVTARIRLLEKAVLYYEKEFVQAGKTDSAAADAEKQINWELAQLRKRRALSGSIVFSLRVFSPDSLFHALKKGQVVRSFFCGTTAIYTLECTSSGISFAEKLPLSCRWQDSLRSFIHTWFQQGANAMIDHPLSWYKQAYALYQDLFSQHPLRAGMEYILCTDGALNLLPVETLVTKAAPSPSPANWPFVIDETLISYGWSLQTLLEQRHTAGGSGFSGFFLSGGRSSALLKAVETEETDLQKAIPSGNWYTNEQATTAAFRKALVSSATVHISSHAFTQKDSLDVPHVELFDDPFYLFELKGLESQPELVVLSACRTGDGRMVTGEGVQSLARAFTGSGANAVIAGWWNVNDATAAQLMRGFYSQLIAQQDNTAIKGNAAQALRAAKLSWLKDPGIPYLHKLPYYWAALNYQGNPVPMKEQFLSGAGGKKGSTRYWVSLLVLVIILVLYRVRRSYRRG